jgi:hypothetical protein
MSTISFFSAKNAFGLENFKFEIIERDIEDIFLLAKKEIEKTYTMVTPKTLLIFIFLKYGIADSMKEAITIDENENSHINTIAYIANYNDGNEYSFEDFEVYDDDYDDDTNMKINTKINATKNVTKVHNGHSSNISSKSTIWREKVINSRKALQDKIYNNKQITK